MISDGIEITPLGKNSRGQTKIGINAPRDVDIHHREVYERIQDEKDLMETINE